MGGYPLEAIRLDDRHGGWTRLIVLYMRRLYLNSMQYSMGSHCSFFFFFFFFNSLCNREFKYVNTVMV